MKITDIRFCGAGVLAKNAMNIQKLLGKKKSGIPGRTAGQFCPDFLSHMEKPETLVYVTGTNGKEEVVELAAKVLKDNNYEFTDNIGMGGDGDSIISALLGKTAISGKSNCKLAVLAVDERYAPLIYPQMQPDICVCTNLFRNAPDWNVSVDFITDILNTNISNHTKMILNGDDLITSHLKPENERIYFGMEKLPEDSGLRPNIIQDISVCPKCDTKLDYDFVRYNHLGRAHCPKCDYGSSEADYDVLSVDREQNCFTMRTPEGRNVYPLLGKNTADLYHEVAAITLLHQLGLTAEQISKSLASMENKISGYKTEKAGNKEVVMCLTKGKNPVENSRIFEFIAGQGTDCAVVLLNYDYQDDLHFSENMAWLYETDYEFLNNACVRQVVVGGKRCYDYQVRALLAGIPESQVECALNVEDVVKLVNISEVDRIYLLYSEGTRPKTAEIKEHLMKRIEKEAD